MPYSDKRLTVGIIGAGEVVSKAHLPVLLALGDLSVAWITDYDDLRAKQIARAYRVRHLTLPKQLSELPYTDIVLLAIPYGARLPYYEVLRNRESAVYVEKPVARTLKEHLRLCSEFPSSRLAVGLQRRAWGPVVLLKKLIRQSAFGRLKRIEFRLASSAIVTSGKSFVSDAKLSGGGILFEHGIHGLDLVLYISGAESASAYRVNTIIEKGFDIHSEGEIALASPAEKFVLDFKVSWLSETGTGMRFVFDQACLNLSLTEPSLVLESGGQEALARLTGISGDMYPATGFQLLGEFWRSFIVAIRNQTINHTLAGTSLLTTELIEQIYAQGVKP